MRNPPKTKGNLFPGVACRFWLFRGVWEKLWELGSARCRDGLRGCGTGCRSGRSQSEQPNPEAGHTTVSGRPGPIQVLSTPSQMRRRDSKMFPDAAARNAHTSSRDSSPTRSRVWLTMRATSRHSTRATTHTTTWAVHMASDRTASRRLGHASARPPPERTRSNRAAARAQYSERAAYRCRQGSARVLGSHSSCEMRRTPARYRLARASPPVAQHR